MPNQAAKSFDTLKLLPLLEFPLICVETSIIPIETFHSVQSLVRVLCISHIVSYINIYSFFPAIV